MMMNVTTNGSNLSVEVQPPSSTLNASSGNNPFSEHRPSAFSSESEPRDSRHDSPGGQDDGDATMTMSSNELGSTAANNHQGHQIHRQSRIDNRSGFVLPPPNNNAPVLPTSPLMKRRVVTGEMGGRSSSGSSSNNGMPMHEERVALAPRFGSLESSHHHQNQAGESDPRLQEEDNNDSSLFSISGSMSSEFLEHQHHHPDHQQEYLQNHHHHHRLVVGMNTGLNVGMTMNSPTSTTARDFLREVQCPPLPSLESGSVGREAGRSLSARTTSYYNHAHSNLAASQRPPFHRSTPLPSSSHSTLMREQQQHSSRAPSPSPTNTSIQGVGSFCDNSSTGRDKPVISRCFAWSQDSQDERRITKRARTTTDAGSSGQISSASSPLSTDEILSPSSALELVQGQSHSNVSSIGRAPPPDDEDSSSSRQAQAAEVHHHPLHPHPLHLPLGNSSSSSSPPPPPPLSPPPTKVHWEEKIDHSNELMGHASTVNPQVLFDASVTTRTTQVTASTTTPPNLGHSHFYNVSNNIEGSSSSNNSNQDVSMGDVGVPPPITTAQSASHYSFESM